LQVKNLITHLGLPIPKAKGEDRESTEAKHLKSLARKNKIFGTILEYRERAKLIDAYMWEVAADGRIHTTFSFFPSTWRKSARNPNVQTVPKRNDLAAEFRRMVIAGPGQVLVECDSSAIEAVLVGFFAGSERYIDLAKKGVHKWLAQEYAQRPVSKTEPLYDQIKRVVHLSNYMGSPQRIHEEYSDVFASVKEARTLQDFYFATPAGQDIKRWHQQVLEQAHKERYLENPWKYRHYFYSVFQYSDGRWVVGDDAKRAVAFLPQSTASAIQSSFMLDIEHNYPLLRKALRWAIHDSLVCEVPVESCMDAARDLAHVMNQPHSLLGGLSIGCEVKYGPNLRDMVSI
jgi:DNA polymerase I-like protein with 3'-5' exonuclease and polymerase domains